MSSTKIPSIAELQDIIMDLLKNENLDDSIYLEIMHYSLDDFNKQNLNKDYYGYHNISHNLVVVHNTLLAARGEEFKKIISQDDFKHLFVAALFHDYEPDKTEDKPEEIVASNFVTSDPKLQNLLKKIDVDVNLVAALILRTSHPWKIKQKEIEPMIAKHYTKSKYSKEKQKQNHYSNLGWFLSITDRIGAYALGDFLDAMELAKKNSHSLGWEPEQIVQRSITYFETLLNEENEMSSKVLKSLPKSMQHRFQENYSSFIKLREKELEIKKSISNGELQLIPVIEKKISDRRFAEMLFDIFDELPDPLQFKKGTFFESLEDPETILVTLRLGTESGEVIGFAKGGPLERYSLSNKINDENYGKQNTIFLEPLAIKAGYWGHSGGPDMRELFRKETKKRKYAYLTGLQLREVIQNRINREDKIEFVQKLNPERLDYYRVTL
ncbi:hypothetical protein C5F49_03365 [Nitrosopumilus oxyclinae]|uniref:Uncharacterized protein n=1 Tax=Nitrosopumilus oxyclinae TaxID=1959104 RepID=A0A7D5R8M2_9ARCH|nr:hypothetical protein [Nitrosopumilus oxyclinae]QLH04462.1 hypothetical protein C5F49_03365 [Nitrosopumilus oxyclinae]